MRSMDLQDFLVHNNMAGTLVTVQKELQVEIKKQQQWAMKEF